MQFVFALFPPTKITIKKNFVCGSEYINSKPCKNIFRFPFFIPFQKKCVFFSSLCSVEIETIHKQLFSCSLVSFTKCGSFMKIVHFIPSLQTIEFKYSRFWYAFQIRYEICVKSHFMGIISLSLSISRLPALLQLPIIHTCIWCCLNAHLFLLLLLAPRDHFTPFS